MKNQKSQNFNLSEDEFISLVEDLCEGDERLFKEIFLAHFESCMQYLMRKCNISHDKAYDVSMDTLLLFRAKCIQGKIKYGNLRFLFTQMAYQRFLKTKNSFEPMSKDEEVDDHSIFMIADEERRILDKAWLELGSNCQELLTKVYYEKELLSNLASELNKSAAALRKQKQRCIEQLRLLFKKQAYEIR